jgi:hypothetical protein
MEGVTVYGSSTNEFLFARALQAYNITDVRRNAQVLKQ